MPVGPVISDCVAGKSSSPIGIPLNTECRGLADGGILTIQDKSPGASADFLARAHSSGDKGFRDMPQSGSFGGWKSFAPNAESMEAAALRYAAARNGGETDVSRGLWGAATIVLSVDDGGLGGQGVAPQLDTSAAGRTPPF